jgi:hypothetical protein
VNDAQRRSLFGFKLKMEAMMAQKGAGGNPGAITTKGGDGAHGSTGTGRGGGNSGSGKTGARTKKKPGSDDQGMPDSG